MGSATSVISLTPFTLKKWVLSWHLKDARESHWCSSAGREFHHDEAQTANVRSPLLRIVLATSSFTAELFDLRVRQLFSLSRSLKYISILGAHLNNVLSWEDQVKHVHKEIVKNLYLLQQMKGFLPIDARKLFLNSYILLHFDYCCVICGNCFKISLYNLEKLHKRAATINSRGSAWSRNTISLAMYCFPG